MSNIEAETTRAAIIASVRILNDSETGRTVRKQLGKFLDGRISNLDSDGWDAVFTLLHAYNGGLAGSVLDAL